MESQAKLLSVLNAEEGLLAKFLYRTRKVWLVYSSKSRRGYFAQGHKVDLNWSKGLKIAHRLIERIETLKVSLSATLSWHTSSQATVLRVDLNMHADKHGCAVHHGNTHWTHSRLTQNNAFCQSADTLCWRSLIPPKLYCHSALLHRLCWLSTKDRPTHQLLPT
jgi:hypothetical protein